MASMLSPVEVEPGRLLVQPTSSMRGGPSFSRLMPFLQCSIAGLRSPLCESPEPILRCEVGHPLEVLLAAMPGEAVAPHRDGLVHATEPERHVAELLAGAYGDGLHPVVVAELAVLARHVASVAVVLGGLAVRAGRGGGAAFEEAHGMPAHLDELGPCTPPSRPSAAARP